MRYTKKSITIEAVQWDGEKFGEPAPDWLNVAFGDLLYLDDGVLKIRQKPRFGEYSPAATVKAGDWITRDSYGAIRMCPQAIFTVFYALADEPQTGMTFGKALEVMQGGERVARAGWNGKGMWLVYIAGSNWSLDTALDATLDKLAGETLVLQPFTAMKTATGGLIPWLASQADIHAHDWQVVHG